MSVEASPLPAAELDVIVSSLETLTARIESIGETQRGTDRGDQISNELLLIAGSVGQAHRRLSRLLKR